MPVPSPRSTNAWSLCATLSIAVGACLLGCQGVAGPRASGAGDPGAASSNASAVPEVAAAPPSFFAPGAEVELFDGSTLGSWKAESVGFGEPVRVEDGAIQIAWGAPGTLLAWTGTRIPESYELALEVMRVEGSGSGYWFLTFPVDGERTCTLTLANGMAWLCGASGPVGDGAMTRAFGLDGGVWHAVRLRVARGRVEARLDDVQLVVEPADAPAAELGDGPPSAPLEMATWSMSAAVRNIRLTRLPDGAI